MTAKRPTRRGGVAAALAPTRTAPPPTPAAAVVDHAPAREAVPAGTTDERGKIKPSKYTLLLDASTAAAFDRLALDARQALNGRRVTKSDLVRALVLLAADDVSLRVQVTDMVNDTLT